MCYEEEGTLFAKFITTDHKPDVPHEESRILVGGLEYETCRDVVIAGSWRVGTVHTHA